MVLRHELEHWLAGYDRPGSVFCVRRLSANDTGATGGHQSGIYLPNEIGRTAFPGLRWDERDNDTVWLGFRLASHDGKEHLAVFKRYHRTKRECRVTRLGDRGRPSPLLDPENTGALLVLCFLQEEPGRNAVRLEAWLCRTEEEERLVEDWFGRPVEPGMVFWTAGLRSGEGRPTELPEERKARRKATGLDLPGKWLGRFPDPAELVAAAANCVPDDAPPDVRLLARRAAEFTLFARVEKAFVERRLGGGFADADEFLTFANSVLNRRRARSGLSLELQVERVLLEERFVPGVHFEREPRVDGGRSRPDFLFPNAACYADPGYPADGLRMLAAKTTLKERWRQILDEAARIWPKHVLTLDEGLGPAVLSEMTEKGLRVVVPAPNLRRYPPDHVPKLVAFGDLLGELKGLCFGF